MKPKVIGVFIFLLSLSLFGEAQAQNVQRKPKEKVDQQEALEIIRQKREYFPKFTAQMERIRKNEAIVKEMRFVRGTGRGNPASAGKSVITIDISFIETPNKAYDDNRLLVVLFHELGHLYYKKQHPVADKIENEKFAFEYSLKRTMELAEAGDCQPLQTAVKFLMRRSQSNHTNDVHVIALKKLVVAPQFLKYKKYAERCDH